jgi:hypothetical protein
MLKSGNLGGLREVARAAMPNSSAQVPRRHLKFEDHKSIMLRCKGAFYACQDGAESRRLNRLPIDAGMIHGLQLAALRRRLAIWAMAVLLSARSIANFKFKISN